MSVFMFLAAGAIPIMPHPPEASARDLSPIALIKTAQRRGSGFLIGPCTALTARHVLATQERGERVTLILPLMRTSTKGTVVDAGKGFGGVPREYDSSDWAVLRLDKCLGKDAGYFPMTSQVTHANQWIEEWGTAVLAGYPAGHNWRSGPYVGPSCTIMTDTAERIDSNCYTYPGHSGSPLLQWQKGERGWKLYVVGIVATGGWGARSPSHQYRVSEAVPIARAIRKLAVNDADRRIEAR